MMHCITTAYRERKNKEYVNVLSYNDVKKLKITKMQIDSHFSEPRIFVIPNIGRAHISIEWCISQPIGDHWMDKWYMIFDITPHKNREVPL